MTGQSASRSLGMFGEQPNQLPHRRPGGVHGRSDEDSGAEDVGRVLGEVDRPQPRGQRGERPRCELPGDGQEVPVNSRDRVRTHHRWRRLLAEHGRESEGRRRARWVGTAVASRRTARRGSAIGIPRRRRGEARGTRTAPTITVNGRAHGGVPPGSGLPRTRPEHRSAGVVADVDPGLLITCGAGIRPDTPEYPK